MPVRMDDALNSSSSRTDAGSELRGKDDGKTGGLRMGDAMSLEMVPTAFVDGAFVVSPEKIQSFKDKGKIGYKEKWERQDKTELIPFNPEAAFKAVTLLGAVNRLSSGEDPVDEGATDQRFKDVALVTQAMEMWEDERIRGFTIGAQVVGGLSYMPSVIADSKIDLPKDWNDWQNLVKQTVEHYSADMEGVYYEVWNEETRAIRSIIRT